VVKWLLDIWTSGKLDKLNKVAMWTKWPRRFFEGSYLEIINNRQGSLVSISLEHLLKIYSVREIDWRISWTH
jgi:hypothetical protein